jgi:hypothetical protein
MGIKSKAKGVEKMKRIVGLGGVLRFAGLALLGAVLTACGSVDDSTSEEDLARVEENFCYCASWQTSPTSTVTSDPNIGIGPLEVCQTTMPDGTRQPGKLFKGLCRVEFGDAPNGVVESNSYKKLYNDGRYSWVDISPNGVPANAVVGDNGLLNTSAHVYICEAQMGGAWHPGKFWKGDCNIEYADRGQRIRPLVNQPGVVKILTHP